MNLSLIKIPPTCDEMVHELDAYYTIFYHEVIRMSNLSINNYLDDYLSMLDKLITNSTPQNSMRAAIGVLSLHRLGFRKFDQLSHIFDKLIPQKDEECVKFTSYIAGQLVHHPDTDQTQYVSHLFHRLVGWITVTGRHQRLLAASFLLCSLAENAGNSIILFIPTIKTTIWHLVSLPFPKLTVLKATARSISLTTRSILRYGRGELEPYLDFLRDLCMKLLSFGNQDKICAGLLFFTELIRICPDYFIKDFLRISELIRQSISVTNNHDDVQMVAFLCAVSLSKADPKQFSDIFQFTILNRAQLILSKDPIATVTGLCSLCHSVPDLMKNEFNKIKSISNSLIRNKAYDAIFKLLETFLYAFPEQLNDFYHQNFDFLLSAPISDAFKSFFAKIATLPNTFDEQDKIKLTKLLESKLDDNTLMTLSLIAELPPSIFVEPQTLFQLITKQTNSDNFRIRKYTPPALFNLSKAIPNMDQLALVRKLLAKAILEKSVIVRRSYLKVINKNCIKEFAESSFLNYYKILLNDDSNKVRKTTLEILAKLAKFNPIAVTSITREILMDYFFVLQNVKSIRQQAQAAEILPNLISASLNIVKTFSLALIMTLQKVLSPEYTVRTFLNFIEENSVTDIQIGVINSLAIIAPHDQDTVSEYSEVIIRLLCSHLHKQNRRRLLLSILNTLQVLLSPEASTINIMTQSTEILAACTSLLEETQSRKTRIAILKVVGTIGVIDTHQKPLPKIFESSHNVDEALARQFFHPFRDADDVIDDSHLLKTKMIEQYNVSIVSRSLLEIFEDDSQHELFYDTASALCEVLSQPRMSYLAFFDQFATRLLDVIEMSPNDQKKEFIDILSRLVRSSSNNISPFASRALDLIKDHFCDELTISSLDLVLSFIEGLGNGFSPYTAQTISPLVDCLDNAKTSKVNLCKRVLEIFSLLGQFATDHRHLIIQQVCDAVVCEQTLTSVRNMSLRTLRIINNKVDFMFQYMGPMMRALKYGLSCQDSREEALQLAYSLIIKSSSNAFLFENSEIPELSLSVQEAMDKVTDPNPSFGSEKKQKAESKELIFSEESVIARAVTPNLGLVRHLESWMNSLILTVIANSPSKAIRASQTIASESPQLARKLFNPAFLSCWMKMSLRSQQIVANSFHELLLADERYDSVARDVLNILVFMDKIERPIEINSRDVINSSIRYGCYTYALKLLERIENPTSDDVIKMIEVYLQLGNWISAFAVWKKYVNNQNMSELSKTELFTKLRMWDHAEIPFKKQYKSSRDQESFSGLLETLSKLSKWNDIDQYMHIFDKQPKHIKQKLSKFFAEACIHLGKWDDLDRILDYSSIGSIKCIMLNALNSLHKKDWNKVDQCFEHGFSVLASQPITFLEDERKIHKEMMLLSQQLIEIREMEKWLQSDKEDRNKIESVWDARLKTAPRDFEMWLEVIGNRLIITQKRDKSLIQFFQLKSISLGTKIHTNAFDIIFPKFDPVNSPDLDRLCHVIALWNTGEKTKALEMTEELLKTIGPELKVQTNYFYALWLLESDDTINMLRKAYEILESTVFEMTKRRKSRGLITSHRSQSSFGSLPIDCTILLPNNLTRISSKNRGIAFSNHIMKHLISDIDRGNIFRKWASVNTALIPLDHQNTAIYVNNAMTALNECIKLCPEFPDGPQLLNLFFENASKSSVFESTNRYISEMPTSLLLQVFPQILIQISHPSAEIAKFVYNLILSLLNKHYHGIIFSIHVLEHSKITSRAKRASQLLLDFKEKQPEIASEVDLIREALLNAAVTLYEKTHAKLEEADAAAQRNDTETMINFVESIFKDTSANTNCAMFERFKDQYNNHLMSLFQALTKYKERPTSIALQTLKGQITGLMNRLGCELESVKMIQLRSVSKELCNKTDFHIAVPGTYKPDKPLILIKYFVGRFGVYATKQQPKIICIMGNDGNFYQYLLKGHEDLRLDERLMQFFKLINSLVKKETSQNSALIRTMSVIPLSLFHGLVQWVKGTDTIKDIVDSNRDLHGKNTDQELDLISQMSPIPIDCLLPIQRQQIILKIFRAVPDTDISNFLWLKAENAELWMKQTTTFAISSAVMSIVGYIIGLGDRHPSNLLIDKYTGKVVHIDFGDSFERAAKRKYKPEIVPFRLTRMMVRAMGMTGVDGPFKNAFINMSHTLRDNRRVLLMILAIFVHEPLVDPDNLNEEARVQNASSSSNDSSQNINVSTCNSNDDSSSCIKKSRSVSASKKRSQISLLRSTSKSNFGISFHLQEEEDIEDAVSNAEAQDRVKQKLAGRDFEQGVSLSVEEQATRLIEKATDIYNLSKMFSGWFPYW